MLIARATCRRPDSCRCLLSQRNNSLHKKFCYGTVWFWLITHVDGVLFSPAMMVHEMTRWFDRSALHGWPPAMQISYGIELDCTADWTAHGWDWVLVQVNLASSVPLWATRRMPTTSTVAISRKWSFTISADKTVVVARTLGACAVFFLVIATTTQLLSASFGATLGQIGGRSIAFQAFFFICLKNWSLNCVKEILDFWSYVWNTQEEGGEQGSFLHILAFLCKSMA